MGKLYWRGFHESETTLKDVLACVGPGWAKLITELIEDLFVLGWDGRMSQVKEKYGQLRFYIWEGTKEIFDRIDRAEADSYKICEECGEPGKLRGGRWYRTLCDKHAAEQGYQDHGDDEQED